MAKRYKYYTGFSLVEVMMAVAILAIGIVGVMQIFPTAIQREGVARNNSISNFWAQGRIEELLSYSYDDSALVIGTTTTSTVSGYQIQTVITYVNPDNNLSATSTDLGIKKIKVDVWWGQKTPEQTLEVVALTSRR